MTIISCNQCGLVWTKLMSGTFLEPWILNPEDEAVNHWNWTLIPPWGSLGCGCGLSSRNCKYYREITIPSLLPPQQLRTESWLYIFCACHVCWSFTVLSDKLLHIVTIIPVIEYVLQPLKDSNGLKLSVGLTQAHLASYPGQVASYPGPAWGYRPGRRRGNSTRLRFTWWSFFQSGSEVVNTLAAPVPRAIYVHVASEGG